MAERLHKIHQFSWYLAGELSPSDQRAVANHLTICAVCRRELSLLRQTIAMLQAPPLEETSVDFVEQFNKRIDHEAELHGPEERQQLSSSPTGEFHSVPEELPPPPSRLSKPTRALLAQRVQSWRCFLHVPSSSKIPLAAGAAMLGLVALLLWHVSPEQPTVPPIPPAALAPLPPAPLSQQATSVAGEAVQPVGTVMTATEQLPLSTPPLASSTETSSIVAALTWRVVGSEPAALHEQVKALVRQMAGAVIVKEEEHLLLISLPTRELSAFHQELTKMEEVSVLAADIASGSPTTLLQVTFVQ